MQRSDSTCHDLNSKFFFFLFFYPFVIHPIREWNQIIQGDRFIYYSMIWNPFHGLRSKESRFIYHSMIRFDVSRSKNFFSFLSFSIPLRYLLYLRNELNYPRRVGFPLFIMQRFDSTCYDPRIFFLSFFLPFPLRYLLYLRIESNYPRRIGLFIIQNPFDVSRSKLEMFFFFYLQPFRS